MRPNRLYFFVILWVVFLFASAEISIAQPGDNASGAEHGCRTGGKSASFAMAASAGEKKNYEPSSPNILFFIVDTLRADRLGCHGSDLSTPAVDKLASRGVLFENAFCHIPITLPSHAAIFSGRYPFKVGVFNNTQHLDDSNVLLAEILKNRGYRTLSVVSLGTVVNDTNLGQGFELYEDEFLTWFRRADEVTEVVTKRLFDKISRDRPWFVFVHFSDPHEPYHAHGLWQNNVKVQLNDDTIIEANVSDNSWHSREVILTPGINRLKYVGESTFQVKDLGFSDKTVRWSVLRGNKKFAGRDSFRASGRCEVIVHNSKMRDLKTSLITCIFDRPDIEKIRSGYAKETEYVDRNIGELMHEFESRGLLENTIVVFSSDHGESLGEHGHVGHAKYLYNPSIRVPLIMSFPGRLPQNRRVENNVRLIDIFPTLLELGNMKSVQKIDGESLLPVIRGEEEKQRPVLCMTFSPDAPDNLVALVEGHYKLIRNLNNGNHELYDLSSDPEELKDLKESELVLFNRMKKKLMDCLSETGLSKQMVSEKSKKVDLDEKRRKALEALGYVQ